MRQTQQLRLRESKRTRRNIGLSAAIFGIAAAAAIFGIVAPSLTTSSKGPGTASHRAADTTADTKSDAKGVIASAYSGGHFLTADPSGGYWTVNWSGAVTAYGGAPTFGSPALSGLTVSKPIVGMAATPDGKGYWLVGSDGGVFSYGDATFYGSTGALHLNAPIVGMAAAPNGAGYWLVASDGGIFTFGDASFYGSAGALPLNEPVVGMAVTPDGAGYWLVASDGGIFTYGDATFYGSAGALHLNEPIVGMAPTADGTGYWLVASDGGIFTYGDATFAGSLAGKSGVLGVVIDPTTGTYTFVEMNGTLAIPTLSQVAAGNAAPAGSTGSTGTTSTGGGGTGPAPSGGGSTTSPPGTTTPTTPPPSTSSGSLLKGSYDGAANPAGTAAFDAATGTHSQIASEYLPSNSGWTGMDGAGGSLNWLTGAWKGKGYILSLGVPIIPTDSSGNAVGSLATGATGAYNGYFVTLAQNLVAAGEGNTYLRLGWEFDGNWYPSYDARTPAAEASFAAYFDQIVTAMRSVPGEDFKFVWNPDAGAFTESGYNVDLAYPGNAYVDIIGLDAYDETWANPRTPTTAWNETILPALSAARAFAAAQGKPLGICEWGIAFLSSVDGLGDDPLYINNFAAWMQNPANDVVYESYFNYQGTSDSILTGGNAPNSLAAFKANFG